MVEKLINKCKYKKYISANELEGLLIEKAKVDTEDANYCQCLSGPCQHCVCNMYPVINNEESKEKKFYD